MSFRRLPERVKARLTAALLFVCLISSLLAGAADTKW